MTRQIDGVLVPVPDCPHCDTAIPPEPLAYQAAPLAVVWLCRCCARTFRQRDDVRVSAGRA